MKITNTTNSSLSMQTSLDPSYISRLRRGQRVPAKNDIYMKSMSKYFSKHCTEEYQRKILFDTLKIIPDSNSDIKLTEYILNWLTNENDVEIENIDRFLTRLTSTHYKTSTAIRLDSDGKITLPDSEVSVYYGLDGKRQAVTCFLSEVLAQNEPTTLLLYSDEPTDWMTADREFAAKWASLMSDVLAIGNKIKIIHTVSRDLDEMLNAIVQWMPLYMSGLIEPYYYPKKRDGIFRRTLFIATEVSALISDSVGNMISEAANLLFIGKTAAIAFKQEFDHYLRLCKPLMRIFASASKDAYLDTLFEFEKEQTDSIIKTESLSLLTMPEKVASMVVSRISNEHLDFLGYHKVRVNLFKRNISSKSFTEIICLPDTEAVINEKVVVAFSNILYGGKVYYTKQEFILHLENLIFLLETYANFHVCLISKETDTRYMVYAKEDLGAIVAKTSTPSIILAINEENMTAAFWGFLTNTAGEQAYSNPNNNKAVASLYDYIRRLKA